MKRGAFWVVLTCLAVAAGPAGAIIPDAYDYCVKQSDDFGMVANLNRGDTLSFDYWYDYTGTMGPLYLGELDLIVHDAGIERDGVLYGDGYTLFGQVNNRYESSHWVSQTFDVPFWLCEDAAGNRRADPMNLLLNVDTWLSNNMGLKTNGHPDPDGSMSVYYVKNVQCYFRDNMNGDEHTVVPEPSSMLLMGTGLIGLAGFEIRRRRAS